MYEPIAKPLGLIPIKDINLDEQSEVVNIVNNILETNGISDKTIELENKLN